MSHIQNAYTELAGIKDELKREAKIYRAHISKLKTRATALEQIITEYITENNLPGVKFKDFAMVVEKKEVHARKPKAERDASILSVLSKYNIKEPKELLQALKSASKGNPETVEKLKIMKTSTRTKKSTK